MIIGSPIAAFRINREKQAAEDARRKSDHLLYVANIRVAQQAWDENNIGELRQLLEETQNSPDRGFEWDYWQRQTHFASKTLYGHLGPVTGLAFSQDGQRIFSSSPDQTAKMWMSPVVASFLD